MTTLRYKNLFGDRLTDEQMVHLESELKIAALDLEKPGEILDAANKLAGFDSFSSMLFKEYGGAKFQAPVVTADAGKLMKLYGQYMNGVLKNEYHLDVSKDWGIPEESEVEAYQAWLDEHYGIEPMGKGSTKASQNTRDAFDNQEEVAVPEVQAAVHNTLVACLHVFTMVGACRRQILLDQDGKSRISFQCSVVQKALEAWEKKNSTVVQRGGKPISYAPYPTPAFVSSKYALASRVFNRVASLHAVFKQFLASDFRPIYELFQILTEGPTGLAAADMIKASGGPQFMDKRPRVHISEAEVAPLTKAARLF